MRATNEINPSKRLKVSHQRLFIYAKPDKVFATLKMKVCYTYKKNFNNNEQ